LASANPATAFNPFGGANNSAIVPGILIGNFGALGESSLRFCEAKAQHRSALKDVREVQTWRMC